MLFEVSRDGHIIHLFGGSRPTQSRWSSPAVEGLAASAEEFWNEVPAMGPEVQALVPKYGIDPAAPLDSWLTDDDRVRIRAAADAKGANVALLATLRPWLAAQIPRMAADAHDGLAHEHSPEAVLTKCAADAGVVTHSEFGTPENVFATFAAFSQDAEVQYLRFTLHEIESGLERAEQQADALARGDLGPSEEEAAMMRVTWPVLYEQLAAARNRAWLPRIETMFSARTRAFVLVGAGHLVGDDGLLALLTKAGYEVKAAG
jgi:uncharacterized protein YbaP (TraB family)